MSYNRTEKNTLMATPYFVSVEVSGDPKLAKVNRLATPQRGKDQSSNEKDYGDKHIGKQCI